MAALVLPLVEFLLEVLFFEAEEDDVFLVDVPLDVLVGLEYCSKENLSVHRSI